MAALRNLENEQVRRAWAKRPDPTPDPIEEEALRACIRAAFVKADEAGLTESAAAVSYVEAAVDFGIGFATDPLHRWALTALAGEGSAAERGELLRRAVRVADPAFTTSEWRHLESTAEFLREATTGPPAEALQDFPAALLWHLSPGLRRVRNLDEVGAAELIGAAHRTACQQKVQTSWSPAVFLLRMILWGHACELDPRYSLIGERAGDPSELLRGCQRYIAENLAIGAARAGDGAPARRALPNGRQLLAIRLDSPLAEAPGLALAYRGSH